MAVGSRIFKKISLTAAGLDRCIGIRPDPNFVAVSSSSVRGLLIKDGPMPALRCTSAIFSTLLLSAILLPAGNTALAQTAPPKTAAQLAASAAAQRAATAATPPSDEEVISTRQQAMALLRISPTLMHVVEADPAILADQDYVTRANPQLAQYLTQHPEVVRNPDFYLFSSIPGQRGRRIDGLRRFEGNNFNVYQPPTDTQVRQDFLRNLLPFLGFVVFTGAIIWLIRVLLESRRWTRVFRLQSEVHSKLIDRFASNQELLHYMETEPGKRFLEAAPIPVAADHGQPLPGGLARVLGPLQLGIVLSLLGIGLLSLQHRLHDIADGLLVFGIIALMPGLGFIISALIAWRIGTRLGLMPQSAERSGQQ
jgi:hypothetical protein